MQTVHIIIIMYATLTVIINHVIKAIGAAIILAGQISQVQDLEINIANSIWRRRI